MLKIFSENGVVNVQHDGSPQMVLAELICAINAIHDDYVKVGLGDAFKAGLCDCVNTGLAFADEETLTP